MDFGLFVKVLADIYFVLVFRGRRGGKIHADSSEKITPPQ